MKQLSVRTQLIGAVTILILIALAGIFYKLYFLKFSLNPHAQVTVWQVEAKISFRADNAPVQVSLAAPELPPGFNILAADEISESSYQFAYRYSGAQRRAVWTSPRESGAQTIYYRLKIFDATAPQAVTPAPRPELGEAPFWESAASKLAAAKLLRRAAANSAKPGQIVQQLLNLICSPRPAAECRALLGKNPTLASQINLICQLLCVQKLPAREIYGVRLSDGRRRQLVETFEVYYDGAWHSFNPHELRPGFPDNYLVLRRGGPSLLDVAGGSNSKVNFSVFKSTAPLLAVVPSRSAAIGRTFGSFSIYGLPLESQNMFKRIALIPLGILLVVIIRNLIGIQTMGTFMPVLIALAFLETRLLPGLSSFLAITAVGLVIRSYLSRLNLLLVPRIAAVVLVVILLMKLFCLISYKIGFIDGLAVTMFPLVIMAWTIERASILWEEDGAITTLKQFGAAVGSGVLCYFVMSSEYVAHFTYAFAEIDLIVLALILLLGTYTGYRVTELRRFKALVQK